MFNTNITATTAQMDDLLAIFDVRFGSTHGDALKNKYYEPTGDLLGNKKMLDALCDSTKVRSNGYLDVTKKGTEGEEIYYLAINSECRRYEGTFNLAVDPVNNLAIMDEMPRNLAGNRPDWSRNYEDLKTITPEDPTYQKMAAWAEKNGIKNVAFEPVEAEHFCEGSPLVINNLTNEEWRDLAGAAGGSTVIAGSVMPASIEEAKELAAEMSEDQRVTAELIEDRFFRYSTTSGTEFVFDFRHNTGSFALPESRAVTGGCHYELARKWCAENGRNDVPSELTKEEAELNKHEAYEEMLLKMVSGRNGAR